VIERFGTWVGGLISRGIGWFDRLPGELQFLIVILLALAVPALAHLDEIARTREWAEFRAWQRSRRRPLKGRRV